MGRLPILSEKTVSSSQVIYRAWTPSILGDRAGLDDLGVDAAEMEGLADRRVHEAERLDAEALAELGAPGVRLVGYLEDGRADGEPCPGQQVVGAQVEVDVELIAGKRPTCPLVGEQGDDACIHHGQSARGGRACEG